jgi:TP901 family phage tail tape measure protein
VAAGAYGAERVVAPAIRAYANLEEATTDLKVALMHKGGTVDKNFEAISKVAVNLGAKLPGSTKDYMGAATALAENGVSPSAIANGGLASAANMGVLLKMDRGAAAETVAKIREAYSLKDEELPGLADTVQRNKFAFGLSPGGIQVAASYSAPMLHLLGLSGSENLGRILTVEGLAQQSGLGDSKFGTNFGMMLTQLQAGPAAVETAKRGMKGRAREVMDRYGINFDFFDENGSGRKA